MMNQMMPMMDENKMFSMQIMGDLNQNPILKNMVSSLIFNPFLIEKMINILTILKYNPSVRNQIQSNLNLQLSPLNYQRMNQNLNMNINPMVKPNYNISAPNQMMNVDSMNKPKESEDSQINNYISVVFRKSGGDGKKHPPIMMQCNKSEKVSDLIERYRIKSGDRDLSERFIYNSKDLNFSLSVEEAGISNNSNIFMIKVK